MAMKTCAAKLAEQARGYIKLLEESRAATDEAINAALMWQRKYYEEVDKNRQLEKEKTCANS